MRTRFLACVVLLLWRMTNGYAQTATTIEFVVPLPVSEGDPQAVVHVICNGSFTNPVTVDFATTNYTATAGLDYVATMGTLTFNPGETNKTIVVPILNDGLRDPSELFRMDLSNPTGEAALGVRRTVYVSIIDNDPGFSIWSSTPTVSEDVGQVYVTVNRGNDGNATVTVDYSTTGVSATPGADYTAVSGTLTFAAGETSRTIAIPIVNDGLKETSETFRLQLSNPSSGTSLGSPNQITITVQDNDPGFAFELRSYSVAENGGQVVVNVRRQDDLNSSATIDYYTTNSTATAGADYTASFGTLTFVAGETAKQITIPILNDALFEGNESFNVQLANPTGGAALGSVINATIVIQDNERGFEFVWPTSEVWENSSRATITVRRQDDSNAPATVDYFTEDGTALAGADYIAVSGTLSFATGETSKSVTVAILNDGIAEGTEHFTVKLGNPTGSTSLGPQNSAVIKIFDNETGFEFSSSFYTFPEDVSEAVLTIRHQGDFTGITTVDFNTVNGTATAGADYTAVSGTLAFAPGETAKEIRVPLVNDGLRESGKSFTVHLSNPTGGGTLGTYSSATVNIQDNDPGVTFARPAYDVTEDAGVASIEIRRGSDTLDTVMVDYFTTPVNATPGADYTAVSGTLTFAPGVKVQFINVPILNDGLVDPSESFFVTLTNAIGGAGISSQKSTTVTIRDNDVPLSIVNPALSEGAGTTNLVVRRGDDGNSPLMVGYSVTGGTAVQGVDYTLAAGTLQFPPGPGTLSIPVTILDNSLVEGDKTIELSLVSASPGSTNTFNVVIEDDEKPVILDPRFEPALSPGAFVHAFACQTNGQVIVSYLDSAQFRYALDRFNADGSLDSSFRAAVTNRLIQALAIQADGRILCGGDFGTNSQFLRLSADGSLDTTFVSSLWPNLGTVRQILLQTDGRIVVGSGSSVSGVYRITIARLNTDGSTDSTYIPAVMQSYYGYLGLHGLVQQTNGQLVLGGVFDSINGVARGSVARLNADGTVDASFNVQFSPGSGWSGKAFVNAVILQPDSRLLVAGAFGAVNGTSRNSLARLNSDGSLDTSFEFKRTNNYELSAVALQPDGRVLVGGWNLGTLPVPRNGLARLFSDGSLDTSFRCDFAESVNRILVCPDDTALISGTFGAINGLSIGPVARVFLESAGLIGAQFNRTEAQANEQAGTVTLTVERLGNTTGSLTINYATGSGTAAPSQDFIPQTGTLTFGPAERTKTVTVSILDDGLVEDEETFSVALTSSTPDGLVGFANPATVHILDNEVPALVDRRFDPELANSLIYKILTQPDGRILLTGYIGVGHEPNFRYLVRLNADGSLDASFQPDIATNGLPSAMILAGEDKILVAGRFSQNASIVRLHQDGTIDSTFKVAAVVQEVDEIDIQPDDRILVTAWCHPLLRLNADGSLDAGFTADLSQLVCGPRKIGVQPDGKILVASSDKLIRLNTDGSLDGSFHSPNFTTRNSGAWWIGALHVQSDGTIWIGGAFTHVDDAARGSIARLNADGTLDATFAPVRGVEFQYPQGFPSPGSVNALALLPDGRILVTGIFNLVEGVTRPFVARLNPDGSLDTSFGPISIKGAYYDYSPRINAVASTTGGNVLIGGDFLTVDGTARSGLVEVFGSKLLTGVEFTETEFTAGEDSTNAVVTVRRIGDVSGAASVQFATAPDTATEGADFTACTATLIFAPLEASKTFAIPLLDDGLDEPDETVVLTLGNATGVSLLGLAQADLRILDNDRAGSLDMAFVDPTIPPGGSYRGSVSPRGLAVQSDGRVLLSGSLTLGTNEYRSLIRLNVDGSLDSSFSVADTSANLLALLPDDRIIVRTANSVNRLLPDGASDTSFYVPFNGWLQAAAVQTDGKLVFAGSSRDILTGTDRGFVQRLNPDGSWDVTFDSFNAVFTAVTSLLPGRDGQLLIAGTLFGPYPFRSVVARLNADVSVDASFGYSDEVTGSVSALLEQGDGRVIAVGSLTTLLGTNTVSGVVRFNPDGSLDPTFFGGGGATTGPQNWPAEVAAVVQQFNGKLIVAGAFTRFHGVERAGLARLNPDGSLDTSFDPGEGAQYNDERYGYYPGAVRALVLLADGRFLAGGFLNEFNDVPRNSVVRVNGDFPAELTPLFLSDGGFRFSLTTQRLRTYVIEVSEDLAQWVPVSTNVAQANLLVFDDPDAPGGSHLFYRAVQR